MYGKIVRYARATLESKSKRELIDLILSMYNDLDIMKHYRDKEARETGEYILNLNEEIKRLKAGSGTRRGGRPRSIPDATREKVMQLHAEGESVRSIARRLDISPATVSRITREEAKP